jgi:hypothetical protein
MDTLNKFLVFPWETSSSFCRAVVAMTQFFMQLSKRETHLPISLIAVTTRHGFLCRKYNNLYLSVMTKLIH